MYFDIRIYDFYSFIQACATMKPWRYLDTGFSNGYENMAVDEAIYLSCQQGNSPPTIRLYGWTPPALSLGYFQKAGESVDLSACAQRGIDVVRRLSGGRAVLHDQELTYSLICPEGMPPFGTTVLEAYKVIGECLLHALKGFHLEVQWVPYRDKYLCLRHSHTRNVNCFSSPSWYEITIEGKKVCGSAQKRGGGAFLQHGSILLEHDEEILADVLYFKKGREDFLSELRSTTTSINRHLKVKVGFYELQARVLKSFEEHLGVTLTKGMLTKYECELKDRLLKEKYARSEWNLNACHIYNNSATKVKVQVA